MKSRILCVGLDVDDVAFRGAFLDVEREEIGDFKSRPTLKELFGRRPCHFEGSLALLGMTLVLMINAHSLTVPHTFFAGFNKMDVSIALI